MLHLLSTSLALLAGLSTVVAAPATLAKRWYPIRPKVVIISMFQPEDQWTSHLGLTENITLPGLSPLFPNITCSPSGDICHMTTGEAEINAACSASALVLATKEFDLTKTYFMIAGIAGVNPFTGTLGGVAIARYAVQVALGYEIDARQMPSNWSTGYFLFDTEAPGQAATQLYGTELFELNTNLRDTVTAYTSGVQLNDSATAQTYRAKYDYAPANQPPSIFYGDVATSDVWFTGSLLDEAFGNITLLWTNNTGDYSMTAEEDNATLEALLRGALAGLVDLSRVILIRTASDFDRPPPGLDTLENLLSDAGGFTPSIENIYIAGKPIVEGIVNDWDSTFEAGIAPQDDWLYNSDDLHTLISQRKREVREYQQIAKRVARMRR